MFMVQLVYINNGSGTRMNTHTGKTTCIDITLTSKTIAAKCSWQVLEDNWSSDHFPILIEYKNTCFQTSYKYTPRWSYKQANWEKFQDSCNELISEPDQTTNIDEIYDMLMVQLNNACNTAIPQTKPHKKNKIPTPWWNEACHQAIQQKKEALKRLRKSFLPEYLINYKR